MNNKVLVDSSPAAWAKNLSLALPKVVHQTTGGDNVWLVTVVDSSRAIVGDTCTTGLQDAPMYVCVCISVHMYPNLYGFELHRPSSKGTKLLLLVIKAIINQSFTNDMHINVSIYMYVYVYTYMRYGDRRSTVFTVLPMRMKHKKVMGIDRKERVNEGTRAKLYQISSKVRRWIVFCSVRIVFCSVHTSLACCSCLTLSIKWEQKQ